MTTATTTTTATILGDGRLGRAIEAALLARGDPAPRVLGRPTGGPGAGHDADDLRGTSVVFEVSRGDAVASNVAAALDAGCRRFVIGTTAWEADRASVEERLRAAGAIAVAASNLSLGAALFLRLVDRAAELFGRVADFDPYVLEWHRRSKLDRPSGTAREIARRLVAGGVAATPDDLEVVAVRAGASPGMHTVGFDAAGETVELRITARDRSAYAAGALAAADWLLAAPRTPGLHPFDTVVDDLLLAPALAATA